MSYLSCFILPGFLGILAITISPLIIQEIYSQEELLVLNNGLISTPSNDYQISGNFEIRIFHDGELIRIKGVTVSGYPYYVYQKMIDGNPVLKGKIFIDGNPFSVITKYISSIKQEQEEEQPQVEYDKKIDVKVQQSTYGYYYDSYKINVKIFDSELNSKPVFYDFEGVIEDSTVNVSLKHDSGVIVANVTGNSDIGGLFEGKYRWGYNDPTGHYTVTLNVNDGQWIETFDTFYRGYDIFIRNQT